MTAGQTNLRAVWDQRTQIEHLTGYESYEVYHHTLTHIAALCGVTPAQAIGVFSALSPNNAYGTNLRDVERAITAHRAGVPVEEFSCTTYGDGKRKAWRILDGWGPDIVLPIGKKTWCFYHNVLHPTTSHQVTVDGHLVGAWRGERLTMDQAKITPAQYEQIAGDVWALANDVRVRPASRVQAVLWHTWKRIGNVLSPAQGALWTTEWEAVEIVKHKLGEVGPTGPTGHARKDV